MQKLIAIGKHNPNEKVRYRVEEEGTYFVYAKGSSRYGWRHTKDEFFQMYTPKVDKFTEAEKWHRNIKKVIKKLEKSGLWPEILETYKNLSTMSYADHKDFVSITNDEERYNKYKDKYPFLFNENGKLSHWDYVGELSNPKFKSMYFGNWNSEIKREIKEALQNKKSYYSGICRVAYDVSFEYNADKRIAWYVEEQRGGGREHSYLVLDESTTVFYDID